MAHQFLICGRECALPSGQSLFDHVFRSGKVPLAELDNHRGHTVHLLAEMNVPITEGLKFREGGRTVQGLLEKGIEELYAPSPLEGRFEDAELGWLLCAFARYFPANARFINRNGMSTGFLRLMTDVMTNNSFDKFSEAGTHELMGLSCGIQKLRGEVPAFSPELRPVLDWAETFLRTKIARYLDNRDAQDDFQIPFLAYEKSRLLEGLGGPHSMQVAIGGHILTVIGMHYTRKEILADPRIVKAIERLLVHMEKLPGELLPLDPPGGGFTEVGVLGAYQRMSYAHAWEALRLIREKLRGP